MRFRVFHRLSLLSSSPSFFSFLLSVEETILEKASRLFVTSVTPLLPFLAVETILKLFFPERKRRFHARVSGYIPTNFVVPCFSLSLSVPFFLFAIRLERRKTRMERLCSVARYPHRRSLSIFDRWKMANALTAARVLATCLSEGVKVNFD